ncbi:hypothetical protein B0H19DRAFT_1268471 [Mycena capillaripes]|nr:hypothetical protein B0H19DRAFT_1268471 [Mycena capillaripes]
MVIGAPSITFPSSSHSARPPPSPLLLSPPSLSAPSSPLLLFPSLPFFSLLRRIPDILAWGARIHPLPPCSPSSPRPPSFSLHSPSYTCRVPFPASTEDDTRAGRTTLAQVPQQAGLEVARRIRWMDPVLESLPSLTPFPLVEHVPFALPTSASTSPPPSPSSPPPPLPSSPFLPPLPAALLGSPLAPLALPPSPLLP